MTITVKAVPRGQVLNGATALHTGDRLRPQDLPNLVFIPDVGGAGPVGAFRYAVDNGHGGIVEAGVEFEWHPLGPRPDVWRPGSSWRPRPAEAPKPPARGSIVACGATASPRRGAGAPGGRDATARTASADPSWRWRSLRRRPPPPRRRG